MKRRLSNMFLAAAVMTAAAAQFSSTASADSKLPADVKAIFDGKPCFTCHKLGKIGAGVLAPNLRYVGERRTKTWLKKWLKNPPAMKKGTIMPAGLLTDAEIEVMARFLAKQKSHTNGGAILKKHGGNLVAAGKDLVNHHDCTTCHKIGGKFGNLSNTAPDLANVKTRRKPDWLTKWLKNPPKVKSGTFMPNFRFSDGEIAALVAYLNTL